MIEANFPTPNEIPQPLDLIQSYGALTHSELAILSPLTVCGSVRGIQVSRGTSPSQDRHLPIPHHPISNILHQSLSIAIQSQPSEKRRIERLGRFDRRHRYLPPRMPPASKNRHDKPGSDESDQKCEAQIYVVGAANGAHSGLGSERSLPRPAAMAARNMSSRARGGEQAGHWIRPCQVAIDSVGARDRAVGRAAITYSVGALPVDVASYPTAPEKRLCAVESNLLLSARAMRPRVVEPRSTRWATWEIESI